MEGGKGSEGKRWKREERGKEEKRIQRGEMWFNGKKYLKPY